ncbi:hypothetical protein A2331_01845 [Candidatus Falkowbacteria bacterium RIFOXYB2_FULL_34_18]|uniref:Uncharacterized protein n=1 Tax=Candidatus Falkowbacteria bacterium RIFOXYD2_FULL_34_120 TaxID=1798007 RepID=A0A1F5TQR5_9BACT|nr:MAG: hypothetical protein A2331_01845 [Candidatus Falkowbacteria bacterium RIFOXYB2_FULL_34_18]OGF29429.1 MAG: hypothetical protein A2500_00910 [Candidatus Falkowbacteria bacterium RIFOXYC12_FULL_34_55]OGF36742.1 MAG: hypothetical protein A2466_03220 [Candidatus Falkowbacteria bacterium RIFOXYC2_FULL_34_220]OGF38955.1 MAG: hypothetical protein A2515_05335 [Candidatus Falkowbacteria bacterium RIFOXYD12_FULL_34_57]OGF41147.1 MAG: hypothetical protein A2531_01335 [Candidatus Falkowbacteria bact
MFYVEQIKGGKLMFFNKDNFKFCKTKTGKKFHIIPIKGVNNKSLCLCESDKVYNTYDSDKDICKKCQKEYWKVIKSSVFRLFCM